MKVRSEDELLRLSDQERVWRIKELALLRGECYTGSEVRKSVLRRAAVPVAYAHWEGFVKKVGQSYLEYVATRRLSLNQLSLCFQSLYFSAENANELKMTKRHLLVPILRKLKDGGSDRIHIKTKDVVSTQGNLNSEVLEDICVNLGLDFARFAAYSSFIDKILLGRRNSIAHGESFPLSETDFDDIVSKVVTCIDIFKNEVENAAVAKAYLA
jgi:hypothetical protein